MTQIEEFTKLTRRLQSAINGFKSLHDDGNASELGDVPWRIAADYLEPALNFCRESIEEYAEARSSAVVRLAKAGVPNAESIEYAEDQGPRGGRTLRPFALGVAVGVALFFLARSDKKALS